VLLRRLFIGAALAALVLAPTASASACVAGTVSSYLTAPCDFGPASLQITSFSNTFGISASQTNVSIVNYGTVSNPFYYLDVQPQSGSFGQYDSGLGTASVQLQVVFPSSSPGTGYSMDFYVVNGCCDVGGVGFSGFPGGTITESIVATTVAVIPDGLYYYAQEQVTSSYSSTWGSNSNTYNGVTTGPLAFFEFSQPTVSTLASQTPEPNSLFLFSVGMAMAVLVRRRISA
jgi:hypothetical protein